MVVVLVMVQHLRLLITEMNEVMERRGEWNLNDLDGKKGSVVYIQFVVLQSFLFFSCFFFFFFFVRSFFITLYMFCSVYE